MLHNQKIWFERTKVPVSDLSQLTLEDLRTAVLQELNSWEWADDKDKPQKFDILHQSRTLLSDDDVKNIGPLSVITIIKKDQDSTNVNNEENHKSAKFIAEYAASRHIQDNLRSCSLALKTAFLNPKFVTMVENLGDSEMLENIFAIVPELKNDPVAIGIIQDPSLIFHLSDPDSLKKLANVKPWVIEAFNFISASIHQEKGNNQPQGIPSHLFNASLFDGDDEAMDDGDDDEVGGPSPRGSGSRITREQIAAALSALGGSSSSRSGLSSSNAFGGLFAPPSSGTQQPAGASRPNPAATAAGSNIQNLMNTLTGAGGGVPGQPLNSDIVARAVTDALRRLTPEQRADQLNAIRNFATQLQQQSSSSSSTPTAPSQQPPVPSPAQAQPVRPPTQDTASALRQQYQSQLQQMRDLGITEERLSILALRVSEGDLNTAVELIFSGWQGEGSDPID